MKIILDKDSYVHLNFHHDSKKRTTVATLSVFRFGFIDQEFVGTAKCRKDETFKTAVGRFVALIDVLKKAGFPREERVAVWDALDSRGVNLDIPA